MPPGSSQLGRRLWAEAARNFILSPPFQAAVQFSVGTFAAGLFVFVRPLNFPLACLAALLLVVVVAVLSPDNHIGTRLLGAATLLGAMAWGLVLGGAVLTLAHAAVRPYCNTPVGCSAHTAILCCVSVVLLAVLVVARAALGPPYPAHVWIAGMVVTLSYGLVLIAGQFVTDLRLLWTNVVGGLLLSCLVASGLSAAVSLLVLPSLAADEMRADAAAAIRGIGHAASRFASRGLQREGQHSAGPHQFHHHHHHHHPRPHPTGLVLARDSLRAAHQRPRSQLLQAAASPAGGPEGQQRQQQSPPAAAAGGPELPQGPLERSQADGSETDWERGSLASDSGYSHGCCRRDSFGPQQQQPPPPPPAQPALRRPASLLHAGVAPQPHIINYATTAAAAEPQAACRSTADAPAAAAAAVAVSPRRRRPSDARGSPRLDPWDSAALAGTGDAAAAAAAASDDRGIQSPGGSRVGPHGASFSLPSSAPTSDDERPAWPLPPLPMPRNRKGFDGGGGGGGYDAGEFEHVMEDEDAFLKMLQEATAPQAPYGAARGGGGGGGGRRPGRGRPARASPPPVVAPPGGILPSPSTRDLMGLGGAASVTTVMASPALPGAANGPEGAKGRQRSGGVAAAAAAALVEGDQQGQQGEGAAAAGAVVSGPPGGGCAAAHGGGGLGSWAVPWAPVSALRPLLARARACAAAAAVEPPWMIRGPADLGRWSRVLSCSEVLLSRVAALESLLEEQRTAPGQPGHSLGDVGLAAVLGVDVVSPYRQVYGEVAASCAAMSVAVVASMEGRRSRRSGASAGGQTQALVAVGGWQSTRERLRSLARTALSSYWARVRAAQRGDGSPVAGDGGGGGGGATPLPSEPPRPSAGGHPEDRNHHNDHNHRNSPQTHGSLHVHLHHHIRLKLTTAHHGNQQHHQQPDFQDSNQQQQQQPLQEGGQSHTHTHQHHHLQHPQHLLQHHLHHRHVSRHRHHRAASKIRTIGLHQARAITFLWTVSEGVISAVDELETAVQQALALAATPQPCGGKPSASAAPSRSRTGALWYLVGELSNWGWARPLGELTLALPLLRHGWALLASHTSTLLLLRGAAARRALLTSRLFQYAVKYWLVAAGSLCFILGLAAVPGAAFMRRYLMLYAYIAAVVSMTDRVESTLSRSALRAGGTLAGGVLGLWVMMLHDWAHSPVGLLAVVAAVAFMTGCLATHRLLYGMYLTVGTLLSIVFCQYGTTPYCCTTPGGTLEMFAARVVSVLLGCTLPVLFSQAVLPWYTSDWGLEIIARAFLSSAKIVRQLYDTFFEEHLRAHVSSRGVAVTADLLRQYGMEEEAEALLRRRNDDSAPTADEVMLEVGEVDLTAAAAAAGAGNGSTAEAAEAAVAAVAAEGRVDEVRGVQPGPQVQLGRGSGGGTAEALPLGGDSSGSSGGGGGGEGAAAAEGAQKRRAVVGAGAKAVLEEGEEEEERQAAKDGGAAEAEVAEAEVAAAAAAGAGAPPASASAAAAATAPAPAAGCWDLARAAMTAEALRSDVWGPLVAVQTSLMKDTAVWSRGIYATPPIVPALLRSGLLLADRLAAVQLVVADTPPPVYGRLSGWGFERMVLPLHREMKSMLAALDRLSVATARLIDPTTAAAGAAATGAEVTGAEENSPGCDSGSGTAATIGEKGVDAEVEAKAGEKTDNGKASASKHAAPKAGAGAKEEEEGVAGGGGMEVHPEGPWAAEVHAAVQELHLCRLQLRQHIHDMRRAFHADVRSLDEQRLSYATHPDDTVHVNSMLYALVKTLDKATALARTALEHRWDHRRRQQPQ